MVRLLAFASLVAIAFSLTIESSHPGFESSNRRGCLTASSNTPGAPVVVEDCVSNNDAQNWDYAQTRTSGRPSVSQPGGQVEEYVNVQWRIFGDKCLDVKDGVNADGTKLQLWTCVDGNTNQLWIPAGPGLGIYEWAGTNKCIDLTDGSTNNGNPVQVWTCDSNLANDNQKWAKGVVPPVIVVPPPSNGTTTFDNFPTGISSVVSTATSRS